MGNRLCRLNLAKFERYQRIMLGCVKTLPQVFPKSHLGADVFSHLRDYVG
jgi:hypothetical protein